MSKVQKHLIGLNLKNGNFKLACHLALCASIENQSVYLPNAYDKVKSHITPHQWAGYLSALTKEGKYSPIDDFWGEVKA